jgi:hypothetical protein
MVVPVSDLSGLAALGDFNEYNMRGTQTLLAYDDEIDDSFRLSGEEAQELPIRSINTESGLRLLVHTPNEGERFAIAPAAFDGGSIQSPEPDEAAIQYFEDLMQLGRVEISSVSGIAPEANSMFGEKAQMLTEFGVFSGDGVRNKTHVLVNTPEGLILKRTQFDCGLPCRH